MCLSCWLVLTRAAPGQHSSARKPAMLYSEQSVDEITKRPLSKREQAKQFQQENQLKMRLE